MRNLNSCEFASEDQEVRLLKINLNGKSTSVSMTFKRGFHDLKTPPLGYARKKRYFRRPAFSKGPSEMRFLRMTMGI